MEDKFCSKCGISLVPLDKPYLSSKCDECGKTAYYVRYSEGGGIKIEDGESFTIPGNFFQLSLDPSSKGKLFRTGLPFFLKQLFIGNPPKGEDEIVEYANKKKEVASEILEKSHLLHEYNLDDEEDSKKAYEVLEKNQFSREWHATTMGAFSEVVKESIDEGNSKKAAWAGYMLGTTRGLTLVTENTFENTLWRGYLANQVVYEAAAASVQTPGEAEAIKKLEPLFRKLDEATLHAWVESNLPIGPRIGVNKLPEEILVPLAKWHLASLQKEKEALATNKKEKRADTEMKIKWLALGVSATGVLFAALKVLGFA